MLLQVLLCSGYSVCIILGISTLVSIVSHMISFSNHCLLFSTGKYEDTGDFTPEWASTFYCNFAATSSTISVLVAMYLLVTTSIILYKASYRVPFVKAFNITALVILVLLFVLISAIFISAGFSIWCGAVEVRFSQGCEAAADSMIITNNTNQDIKVNEFIRDLETAQFSVWSSLVVWVFILTISGRLLFVAHERANIRISMERERHRYNQSIDNPNQPSNLPHYDIT